MADLPLKPLFLDIDGIYDAKHDRQPWMDTLVEGVVGPADYAVTAQATPNMTVRVAGGRAWVQGDDTPADQGMYHVYNSVASTNLTIAANSSGSTRTDSIVVRAYDAPTNKAEVAVVAGPAGGAAATIPNNAHELARITVANAATSITNGNIEDRRGRHHRQIIRGVLATDPTMAAGSNVARITLPSFTLARPRRVLLNGQARITTTASGTDTGSPTYSVVGIRAVAGGTTYASAGPQGIGPATSDQDRRQKNLAFSRTTELAAGTYTFTLVTDRDATTGRTITVDGSLNTANFPNYDPTFLEVIL